MPLAIEVLRLTVTLEEDIKSCQCRQEKMLEHKQGSHGLPALSGGAGAWMQPVKSGQHQWTQATVFGERQEPSSYDVRIQDGAVLRKKIVCSGKQLRQGQ